MVMYTAILLKTVKSTRCNHSLPENSEPSHVHSHSPSKRTVPHSPSKCTVPHPLKTVNIVMNEATLSLKTIIIVTYTATLPLKTVTVIINTAAFLVKPVICVMYTAIAYQLICRHNLAVWTSDGGWLPRLLM